MIRNPGLARFVRRFAVSQHRFLAVNTNDVTGPQHIRALGKKAFFVLMSW
jgi:hypothetical protein